MGKSKTSKPKKSKKQQIEDLYKAGTYIWEIAQEVDVTESRVVTILEKLGLYNQYSKPFKKSRGLGRNV